MLSSGDLNRALLARQLLLERAAVAVPVPRGLEAATVMQGTLQRITIYLVSAGDYWPVAIAVRSARRRHWLRTVRGPPVRFLPTWDAMLLVHARRKVALAEEHRSRIFNTKTPHSLATFLVDGKVAGTWRHDGGRVRVDPFGELSRRTIKELEAEAARPAVFHA